MVDDYYVISTSEDGDASIEGPLSKAEIEKRFTPETGEKYGYYGTRLVFGSIVEAAGNARFAVHDLTSKAGLFVIKGRIVALKPITTVTKWEVE